MIKGYRKLPKSILEELYQFAFPPVEMRVSIPSKYLLQDCVILF